MYIIGHKNPDTDAIVCALIAADYFTQLGMEVTPIRLGELNKETEFILKSLEIQAPELKTELEQGSKICLVDHNEASQAIDNLEKYQIDWVIDHHKFNLQTASPLNIRAEGLASTASVLYKMYNENNLEITEQIAKLMICGILSDTLNFKSPTTTDFDIQIMLELNKIANFEDLDMFATDMFDAKSNISNFTAREIVEMDYKTYEIGDKKISIGVVETTNTKYSLDKSQEILEVIRELKEANGLYTTIVFIVDILKEESIGICESDKEVQILMNSFKDSKQIDTNHVNIGNILSRKKQMVPAIEKTIL